MFSLLRVLTGCCAAGVCTHPDYRTDGACTYTACSASGAVDAADEWQDCTMRGAARDSAQSSVRLQVQPQQHPTAHTRGISPAGTCGYQLQYTLSVLGTRLKCTIN